MQLHLPCWILGMGEMYAALRAYCSSKNRHFLPKAMFFSHSVRWTVLFKVGLRDALSECDNNPG